ncbi:MAG: cobaltochelatase subunit CobN, partial [Bacteroidales bacterium]
LLNTSVVVQPRSGNTWGPLSLDHVYEFMGGLSAAVQHVTGNDPTAYFNDFRNTSRAKVQGLKEAIGVETSSTLFNPKYITQKLKGEASSLSSFAETVRNTYGWNAMKPSAIDQHIWNQYHEVYVKDSYGLGIQEVFSEKNPYAMQEITAVMLESARKGMWKATKQQISEVAELHTRLVESFQAGCSGFICDNKKLQDFIVENIGKSSADTYKSAISAAREVQMTAEQTDNGVVLKKENQTQSSDAKVKAETDPVSSLFIVLIVLFMAFLCWIVYRRLKG